MASILTLLNNSVSTWLPGLGAMPNLHPLFIHFPIALLGAFVLAQLIALLFNRPGAKIAADWLLYMGALGAVGAAIAGLVASQTAPHAGVIHTMMTEHRNMGLNAAALALLLSILRLLSGAVLTKFGHISHLLLGGWIFLFIIKGADLGGSMVYQYGVGVQDQVLVKAKSVSQAKPIPGSQPHSHSGHGHGGHNHGGHGGGDHHGTVSGQLAEWFSGLFGTKNKIRPHTH